MEPLFGTLYVQAELAGQSPSGAHYARLPDLSVRHSHLLDDVGGVLSPRTRRDPLVSLYFSRTGTHKVSIPIEPASKRPAHRVTECQAWAATWLGSEVEERCPSATVHGSLFCTFRGSHISSIAPMSAHHPDKHAIEDHNMAVKERKQ